MPTILRHNGFRFIIWPNDYKPPHVHVKLGSNEAIINLGIDGKPPYPRANYGLTIKDLSLATFMVAANNSKFLEQWVRIHGEIKE